MRSMDIENRLPNINALRRRNPSYDPALAKTMRQSIRANAGGIYCAVHLGSSLERLRPEPSIKMNSMLTLGEVTPEDYFGYMMRNREKLCSPSVPVLMLADDHSERIIKEWLPDLAPGKRFILCRTFAGNPTPIFDASDLIERSRLFGWMLNFASGGRLSDCVLWAKLFFALRDLGVRHIDIGGELAYTDGDRVEGCVNYARPWMAKFPGISVNVIPELTFPNTPLISTKDRTVRLTRI